MAFRPLPAARHRPPHARFALSALPQTMARKPPEPRDTRGSSGARRGRPPGKAGCRPKPRGRARAVHRGRRQPQAPTPRLPAANRERKRGQSNPRYSATRAPPPPEAAAAAGAVGPARRRSSGRWSRSSNDWTSCAGSYPAAGTQRQARRRLVAGRRSGRARSG